MPSCWQLQQDACPRVLSWQHRCPADPSSATTFSSRDAGGHVAGTALPRAWVAEKAKAVVSGQSQVAEHPIPRPASITRSETYLSLTEAWTCSVTLATPPLLSGQLAFPTIK